jgi:hypothetical protein
MTGSFVPVAVRRAISTPSFSPRVWSSAKEIGFVLDEGLELELELELDLEVDELELGLDELELGLDELELGLDELELGLDELELELGLDEEIGLVDDDSKPSTVGSTTLASFFRKRRLRPISSTSRTFSCGGL